MARQAILDKIFELQSEEGATIQEILEAVKVLIDDYKGFAIDSLNGLDGAEKMIDVAMSLINIVDKEN